MDIVQKILEIDPKSMLIFPCGSQNVLLNHNDNSDYDYVSIGMANNNSWYSQYPVKPKGIHIFFIHYNQFLSEMLNPATTQNDANFYYKYYWMISDLYCTPLYQSDGGRYIMNNKQIMLNKNNVDKTMIYIKNTHNGLRENNKTWEQNNSLKLSWELDGWYSRLGKCLLFALFLLKDLSEYKEIRLPQPNMHLYNYDDYKKNYDMLMSIKYDFDFLPDINEQLIKKVFNHSLVLDNLLT